MTTTIDAATLTSPESIDAGGTRIAEAFGLGDSTQPSADWPVDDGDTVLAAEISGVVDGLLLLAVNDQVAARLSSDASRLRDGFAHALSTMLATSGLDPESVELGEVGPSAERPDRSVEIFDGKQMCALFGAVVRAPEAEAAAADVAAPAAGSGPIGHGPTVFEPASLAGNGATIATPSAGPLSLLQDVEMDVTVELGRTRMPIRELLSLQPGMVVEIDRQAGAPIDVLVNGRLIACGEVVVIDEEFGIRITEIVDAGARL